MTAILGLSAFYHDSAAALVVDGQVIAAAQEERFTRRKHDASFPRQAVGYCLRQAGLTADQLDHVVFYEKSLRKFDRLLETYLAEAPLCLSSFFKAVPVWLHEKLRLSQVMHDGLDGKYCRPFVYVDHHEAHAASAFFPSPFEEAALLTVDGVGEWATATFGTGRRGRIELSHEMRFPHSLGLLYSAFTYFCGFKVNSGEYKLMGLAPYGAPKYAELILRHLVDLRDDGSFHLNLEYFNYCSGLTMTSDKFARLFGGPPRSPESPLTEREFDLAASIQQVTEEIVLRMARHLHRETGQRNLCMAGGVALNCVANGRLLREGPFEKLWVQPAAGDSGGALGAALFTWHQLLEKPRAVSGRDTQRGSLLGPEYSEAEIEAVFSAQGAVSRKVADDASLCEETAALIAAGKVVGWFQGRMEFGPRALGGRSILGDARNPEMQSTMNTKIKFRESFRPFAPIVLADRAGDYFDLPRGADSPYMLLVAPVRAERRRAVGGSPAHGVERVRETRSDIPAVTHVDYSARIQTVDAAGNPLLHRLLRSVEDRTGCPVLINTSFNVRSEPIVCTPADAYRCFMATDMDALVVGRYILLKEAQPASARIDRVAHLGGFASD
jgi:carbamoyltransferase